MRRPKSGFPHQAALCLLVLLALAACSDPSGPSDQPTILLLNPRGVPLLTGPIQLTLYGENFGHGSTVYWNDEVLPSASTSSSVIYTSIPFEKTQTAARVNITVVGPTGKRSRAATLTVGGDYLGPAITLTAITPPQGIAGSGDLEITATGTGFIEGTALYVEGGFLETTWVSSTTLRAMIPAAYLQVNRTLEVRPGIPDVWLGPEPLVWEVQAEVPAISSLDPAAAAAGSEELPIRVLGSGFTSTSIVRVNGGERVTTFVSSGELGVTLTSFDLLGGGTVAITVQTPAPGGGASPATDFVITNQAPELAPLPLLGVTAGRPFFTLVVHGRHFTSSSVIQWNGSDRETHSYRSGRRLMATIHAPDVASPGQASITVTTPGFPPSSPRTLTIHPVPSPTVTDIKSVSLPANWLAFDSTSGRLFATVPGTVPTYGNTVTEIDPVAGAIGTSVFVGSGPYVAEASDDGQYLYVGLDGAQAVRRVSLPGFTPGLQFSLGNGLQAEELHVMPGRPQTVAVSRRNPGLSPSNSGLVIYDDGVARGLTGPDHTGSNTFGWTGDGSSIFGYNFETTEFGLRRLNVGPEGAREVWVRSGLIDNFFTRVQVVGDQIYGGDGSVVDGDLRERLGACSMTGRVMVDRELGRAFYWSDDRIRVCELATYQSLGDFTVPGVAGPHPAERRNLVRWGTDGLAFSDGTKIHLVRTPLAAP